VFGKPFSEYVRFAGLSLALIAGVALLRLVLSLAGMPNSSVRWLSATVVLLLCALVYAARVHTTGFGSYKQILPVVWLQAVTMNVVVIAGIVLAIFTGQDNIFTAPEFAGGQDGKNWFPHVFGHVVFGLVAGPLVLWGLGSLVMLVTKKVSKGPGAQRAAA
jgi:cation transport ATPase